jgi:hypothetical protein
MRSILQNVILASAIASTALATNSAMAASTVNIPFNFTAAGKTLPAGNYLVKHDSTGSFVTLESADASQSLTWLLCPGEAQPTDRKIVLRFDDEANTHVLQSVQFGPMITQRLDKDASKKLASVQGSLGQ